MHDTSVNCYQIKKKVYIFEITVIYTCKNERYFFDRVLTTLKLSKYGPLCYDLFKYVLY